MTNPPWFVDTNIVVYLFDATEQDKQKKARAIFSGPDVERLALSTQVLGEFYVTASRKLSMTERDLDHALTLLAAFPVHAIRSDLVLDAVTLSRRHQISYWDGLIVATAAAHGCTRILTEDLTHGQTLNGVELVNPFV